MVAKLPPRTPDGQEPGPGGGDREFHRALFQAAKAIQAADPGLFGELVNETKYAVQAKLQVPPQRHARGGERPRRAPPRPARRRRWQPLPGLPAAAHLPTADRRRPAVQQGIDYGAGGHKDKLQGSLLALVS